MIDHLREHSGQRSPTVARWSAHLAALGITTSGHVQTATEGVLWGCVKAHGLDLCCVTDGGILLTKGSIIIIMVAKARSKSTKDIAGRMRGKASRVAAIGRFAAVSTEIEEARRAGLLDGATVHVSFRAPKALVEAAKRESGATKSTELGLLALAVLAQPDPVESYLRKTRGKLGPDHRLDY